MIDKKADSKDPVQQELRNLKKEWNKEVSVLIAQLIAFKKGLNGRGDPRAGLPPSNIKDPFPQQVPGYLDNMVSRFQAVTNVAEEIITNQDNYSKTRRKGNDDVNHVLEKSAANRLTRLWTWVTQYPYFNNDIATKDRINLLYSLADFEKQVNTVESILTSSDKNALSHSFYNYMKFISLFKSQFVKRFNNSLDNHAKLFVEKIQSGEKIGPPPPRPSAAGAEAEEDSKENESLEEAQEAAESMATPEKINKEQAKQESSFNLEDMFKAAEAIISDVEYVSYVVAKVKTLINLGKVTSVGSSDIINALSKTTLRRALSSQLAIKNKNNALVKKHYTEMTEAYQELLQELSKFAGLTNPGSSVESILEAVSEIEKKSYTNNELVKLADKQVRRWLNRLRLSLYSNELDQTKLNTAKKLDELTKTMQITQDLLQNKDSVIVEVADHIIKIYELLGSISEDFITLGKYHNYDLQSEKSHGAKPNSSLINQSDLSLLERNKSDFSGEANNLKSKVSQIHSEQKGENG